MSVESPAWSSQNSSFPANQTRRAVFFPLNTAGGCKGSADLEVTAPSSGMSVNVGTGEVIVPGSNTGQGLYYGWVSSQTNLTISASDPTNPRIDTVCATIYDKFYGASADSWVVQVVAGTPTAGATLSNLDGAASLPSNSLLIAYVLVPAGATSIVSADIQDERIFAALAVGTGTAYTGGQAITVTGTTIKVNGLESVNVVSASGTSVALANPANDIGNDITLSASCTITMPAASAGLICWAFIHQAASGGPYTVTWPSAGSSSGDVNWPGATAPTMTATAGAVDLYEFVGTAGGYWRGTAIQNFAY